LPGRGACNRTPGERAILDHLAGAGPDASRKLSTLRFITGSFQRHLERLLALEEYGGASGDTVELQVRQEGGRP
jgi:hypothetical protein